MQLGGALLRGLEATDSPPRPTLSPPSGSGTGTVVKTMFGPVGQPSPSSVLSPPSGVVRCTHVSWGVLAAPLRRMLGL